jgi:ATP-binding cassette subfamily A (ABC1) protein 3
VLHISQLVK